MFPLGMGWRPDKYPAVNGDICFLVPNGRPPILHNHNREGKHVMLPKTNARTLSVPKAQYTRLQRLVIEASGNKSVSITVIYERCLSH